MIVREHIYLHLVKMKAEGNTPRHRRLVPFPEWWSASRHFSLTYWK